MKSSLIVFAILTLSLSSSFINTAQASVVADGATLKQIASGYSFTEGPAVDAFGNIFFTDQPNNKILKMTPDGTVTTFLSPCGRANGLFFDSDGFLWACADYHNELWKIDPNGSYTVVVDNYLNKLLNGPNDLWVRRFGGIYFTDPLYNRNYWDHRSGKALVSGQHVYYLAPDMETVIQVTNDLSQPNGIVGTADGKFLYVADYSANKTYRYTIQPDGTLGDKLLFCSQGSDGITIDEQGNIYLTRTGVSVYDKSGNKTETISVPGTTTNVTFGGPDNKTLYITAGGSLYSLEMNVRGTVYFPDFNSDLHVDFSDYTKLAKSWKQADPNVDLGPTTTGDGIINMLDIAILAENWLGEDLPLGLRAYWNFDQESGMIAKDKTGSYNAMIWGDQLWVPDGGKFGGALLLDGLNDYGSSSYILGPTEGSFSTFIWIQGGEPNQVILSQAEFTNWLSTDSEGKLLINLAPIDGRFRKPALTTDIVVTDGDWHQVGLAWNQSVRIAYVDGIEVARDEESLSFQKSTNGYYFGTDYQKSEGTYWSGMIDDLRFYDYVAVPK